MCAYFTLSSTKHRAQDIVNVKSMFTKIEVFKDFAVVVLIVFLLIMVRRKRLKIVPAQLSLFLFIFNSPQGKTELHTMPLYQAPNIMRE